MSKKIIFLLITFAIGIGVIWYLFERIGSKAIWETLFSFPPWGIILGLLLTFAFAFFSSLVWQEIILAGTKKRISPFKLTPTWIAGFALSYFTPIAFLGGEVLRAYVLKKRFFLPLRESAVSVFIEKIFEGTAVLLIILFGILLFFFQALALALKLWAILLIFLFPIGGLIFFYSRAFKSKSMVRLLRKPLLKFTSISFQNGIELAEKEVFNFFDLKNRYFWRATLWNIFRAVVFWLRAFVILLFLGVPINFLGTFALLAFAYLSYLFPLPAGLGSLEALQILVFSVFSLPAQSAIAFALILRIFDSLMGLFGLGLAFRFGAMTLKENDKS